MKWYVGTITFFFHFSRLEGPIRNMIPEAAGLNLIILALPVLREGREMRRPSVGVLWITASIFLHFLLYITWLLQDGDIKTVMRWELGCLSLAGPSWSKGNEDGDKSSSLLKSWFNCSVNSPSCILTHSRRKYQGAYWMSLDHSYFAYWSVLLSFAVFSPLYNTTLPRRKYENNHTMRFEHSY